jgi:NDP-sugar pyrophosphorylase family protein
VDSFALCYFPRCCAEVAIVDIRALVLIGGVAADVPGATERVSGFATAYLDVLGLPVVERVLDRLRSYGITTATLVSDAAEPPFFAHTKLTSSDVSRVQVAGEQLWQRAEETFLRYAEDGADLVLVLRLGAYVEVDYEALIQHHLDHRCCVSMAVDRDGAGVDLFVLNTSARQDAAALFQSGLRRMRRKGTPFLVSGYVNRLQTPYDLRRLAVDGLLARNAVRPEGTELRPGVWVGWKARIHRRARVIAPAFIGDHVKVRAAALITRGTVIEHHGEIDCGTVVENSTVLPSTRIGAGLDMMHSVVGFGHLAHLQRAIEVEIADEKFIGMVPLSAISRLAGSTAALFTFLPMQLYRGLLAKSHRRKAARILAPQGGPAALEAPPLEVPAARAEASEFPSNLATVRRYGDH